MKYIVLDIGCIECGEKSAILGIFDNEQKAKKIMEKYEKIQSDNWHGQHQFYVVEIKEETVELYDKKSYLKHNEWW